MTIPDRDHTLSYVATCPNAVFQLVKKDEESRGAESLLGKAFLILFLALLFLSTPFCLTAMLFGGQGTKMQVEYAASLSTPTYTLLQIRPYQELISAWKRHEFITCDVAIDKLLEDATFPSYKADRKHMMKVLNAGCHMMVKVGHNHSPLDVKLLKLEMAMMQIFFS